MRQIPPPPLPRSQPSDTAFAPLPKCEGVTDQLTRPRSFFKTLIDQEVTVELKNDIQIRGVLKSVDQYLNIKLEDIQVVEELKYPHLVRRPPSLRHHRSSR